MDQRFATSKEEPTLGLARKIAKLLSAGQSLVQLEEKYQALHRAHEEKAQECERISSERDAWKARCEIYQRQEGDEEAPKVFPWGVIRSFFRHDFPEGIKPLDYDFSPKCAPPAEADIKFVQKLASVYFKEQENSSRQLFDKDPGIWNSLMEGHKEIVTLLSDGALLESASYLDRMCHTPLTTGFAMNQSLIESMMLYAEAPADYSLWSHDRFLSFAEAIGAVSVENPESKTYGDLAGRSLNEVLELVENKLGTTVRLPRFNGGMWGANTIRGWLTGLDPSALYLVNRIKEIFRDKAPLEALRIGEIGAGLGHVAFHAISMGCRDYTIFDLPTINIAQSWFLRRNYPEIPLTLSEVGDSFADRPAIRVLSTRHFSNIPHCFFDLVINADSLPELSEEVALTYLRGLRSKSRYFLSINHEAEVFRSANELHHRVSDLAAKAGGFRRILRAPCWIRKGYVEELYEVSEA